MPQDDQKRKPLGKIENMPRPKSSGLAPEEQERLRVSQLLEVASKVFLEAGYEAASTTEIAKRARSSKHSFYSRFPSKEKLFLAVIDYRTSKIADQMSTLLKPEEPIRGVLIAAAKELLAGTGSVGHLALVRLVYMEAPQFPEAARYLLDRGPDRGLNSLAGYLKQQVKLGRISIKDPLLAAQQFAGLVIGDAQHRALLGAPVLGSKRLIERRAETSVDAFLQIYPLVQRA